jgi:hypothetical protein
MLFPLKLYPLSFNLQFPLPAYTLNFLRRTWCRKNCVAELVTKLCRKIRHNLRHIRRKKFRVYYVILLFFNKPRLDDSCWSCYLNREFKVLSEYVISFVKRLIISLKTNETRKKKYSLWKSDDEDAFTLLEICFQQIYASQDIYI